MASRTPSAGPTTRRQASKPSEPWLPPPRPEPTAATLAPPGETMMPGAQRNSGKAVAALVLGIASLLVAGIITGTLAIIFGALGLKEVGEKPHLFKGHGMAMAGLVLGIIGLVLAVVVLIAYHSFLPGF